MTTTDPRAAAIEAFKAAWEDADRRGEKGHRTEAGMAAAVPHLTAGLRALHYRESGDESLEGEWCAECGDDWPCSTTQALDALERGGDQ